MMHRKLKLYAVIVIALTACTKQDITTVESSSSADAESANNSFRWWHRTHSGGGDSDQATIFGLIEEDANTDDVKADMSVADVNLIRIPIFLSETTASKTINDFLDDGYNVQINANWFNDINGSRTFPTDTDFLKEQAEAFFQYYAEYKDQIPFVAVENEWDYEVQHGANVQDYLTELAIVTDIGHKYGFKIADGGITSAALQRWTYSQLSGDEQDAWGNDYYVGINNDYDALMDIVNTYIATAKNIDFDYCNVHWYNTMRCGDGFGTATETYMKACNKKLVACNEFGIRTDSLDLYTETVDEIKGNTSYAVAYSGSDIWGKPIKLTDDMLEELH